MGVDLEKLRKRQQEEEAKAAARQSGGFRFWTPKVGKNKIRLLPPWTDEGPSKGDFFREVFLHWNVGPEGKQYICPKKTPLLPDGLTCPICEHIDQLRRTGDPVDLEQADTIKAKQQFYSNIVDLDDPVITQKDVDEWMSFQADKTRDCPLTLGESKVQTYKYGPSVYYPLLDYFADMGEDFTDLEKGRDIIIRRTGEKLKTRYRVVVDGVVQPLQLVGKLQLKNLTTLAVPKERSALEAALITTSDAPSLPEPAVAAPAALPEPPAPEPEPAQKVAQGTVPPKDVEPESDEETSSDEEPPECFKDANVFNESDAECTGGVKGDDEFDPCPFFQDCGEALGKLKKKRGRRRRKAAKPTNGKTPAAPNDADKLEAEMAAALKR